MSTMILKLSVCSPQQYVWELFDFLVDIGQVERVPSCTTDNYDHSNARIAI